MTYDDVSLLTAKIKPKQQRVENKPLNPSVPFFFFLKRFQKDLIVALSLPLGGAASCHGHKEPQLLQQQGRADSAERGRHGLRGEQHLFGVGFVAK